MSEQVSESIETMLIKHNEDFNLPSKEDLMRVRNLDIENQQLKARIARLYGCLIERDGGAHDVDCKSRNGNEARCNCGHDYAKRVIFETEQQSLAAIQVDAINKSIPAKLEFSTMTFACDPDYVRGYNQCRLDVSSYANQLRNEAKG